MIAKIILIALLASFIDRIYNVRVFRREIGRLCKKYDKYHAEEIKYRNTRSMDERIIQRLPSFWTMVFSNKRVWNFRNWIDEYDFRELTSYTE